jgi:hypothetical protein
MRLENPFKLSKRFRLLIQADTMKTSSISGDALLH